MRSFTTEFDDFSGFFLNLDDLSAHERRMIDAGWWPVPNGRCQAKEWEHSITGHRVDEAEARQFTIRYYRGRWMTPPPF